MAKREPTTRFLCICLHVQFKRLICKMTPPRRTTGGATRAPKPLRSSGGATRLGNAKLAEHAAEQGELCGMGGFDEVQFRPVFVAAEHVAPIFGRGEHYDRNVACGIRLLEATQELKSVHKWQVQVQKNHLGCRNARFSAVPVTVSAKEEFEGFLPVAHDENPLADPLANQCPNGSLNVLRIVLDDQNIRWLRKSVHSDFTLSESRARPSLALETRRRPA